MSSSNEASTTISIENEVKLKRVIGLFDGVLIILGTIIGTIFSALDKHVEFVNRL